MADSAGYVKKPWPVYALISIYLALPVCSLILTVFTGKTESAHIGVYLYLALDILLTGLACAVIFAVSPWSMIGLYLLACLKVWHQTLYDPQEAELVILQYAQLLAWFLLPLSILTTRLRNIFFFTELQWWKQSPRYPYFSYGFLFFKKRFPIVTLNISGSGAMIKLDERLPGQAADFIEQRDLERRRYSVVGRPLFTRSQVEQLLGEEENHFPKEQTLKVRVGFPLTFRMDENFKTRLFECDAEIVWTGDQDTYARYHLGLRFINLSDTDKRNLSRFVRVLERKTRAQPKRDR